MTALVIVGTGGQAREAHAVVETLSSQWFVLGFLDDATPPGTLVHGLPVLGTVDWLRRNRDLSVHIGVGADWSRRRVVERIAAFGDAEFPVLIHPSAMVGPGVEFGKGTMVGPGAVLTTDIEVGEHALINFGAMIGRDSLIGDFATVAPGVRVSRGVRVGEGADIGTGASLSEGVSVGAWSVVGAGAVVCADVPPDSTVVGVPARVIHQRSPGWHLEARAASD